ncbi:collagen-binding domain-containing protein [Nocardiopsis sp. LOL_012]|uniref:collagen-binding domain-containing protein n=1 Tax=Nocardiopsis sp. LOL_012 TaxID=3345409 RepID=UPI003A8BC8A2
MPRSPRHPSPALKGASAGTAALLAFALAAPGTAAADTSETANPLEGNRGFLVVVEGDAELAGNESEGPIAVGGDLTFGPYNIAAHTTGTYTADGDDRPSALVVNGSVDLGGSEGELKVLQNGYVKVGETAGTEISTTDSNDAQVNTVVSAPGARESNPRITLTTRQSEESVTSEAFDVAALFPAYRDRAEALSSCENTVVPLGTGDGEPASPPFGSGANVTLPLEAGANVWNVDAEDLADLEVITFDDKPSADSPLLVNVDTSGVDGEFEWSTPNMAGIGLEDARYILFNFGDAELVTFTSDSRTLEGTVFAPGAEVNWLSASNIQGAVVAASFGHGSLTAGITNNGELHNGDFAGELPVCGGGDEPTDGPSDAPSEDPSEEPSENPSEEPSDPQSPSESPSDPASPEPTEPDEGGLPVTGSNLAALVVVAVVLVGAGAAAFVLGRRRKA